MADEKTYTQADIDAAVQKAIDKVQENLDKLEAKNQGLLDDLKKAQREARAAKDIKPEDLAAAEERADRAEAALKEAQKLAKDATTAKEKAEKALVEEQGAARNAVLERDLVDAVAAGNIIPSAVPQYTAWLKAQDAKVEVVDGKLVTTVGGKLPREFVTEHLGTEEGKTFRAAAINGGGGAPGSGNGTSGAKTMTREQFEGLDQPSRASFAKEGGKLVDQV